MKKTKKETARAKAPRKKQTLKKVYIAFGANKNNPRKNIKLALQMLGRFGKIKKVSPVIKTKPEGFLQQPDFYNGALLFLTPLAPKELLKNLKKIERALGRKPSFKNAPREIDLDIIFYEDAVVRSKTLSIPPPKAHRRFFVLKPLSAVAPRKKHPLLKKTVLNLLKNLEK
jgi:2-amino-4-hydroxy-6-hydroxymethyldihydropteridine diphosphokinase